MYFTGIFRFLVRGDSAVLLTHACMHSCPFLRVGSKPGDWTGRWEAAHSFWFGMSPGVLVQVLCRQTNKARVYLPVNGGNGRDPLAWAEEFIPVHACIRVHVPYGAYLAF